MGIFLPVPDIKFPVVPRSDNPARLGSYLYGSLKGRTWHVIAVNWLIDSYRPWLAAGIKPLTEDFPAYVDKHVLYAKPFQVSSHEVATVTLGYRIVVQFRIPSGDILRKKILRRKTSILPCPHLRPKP